MGRVKGAALLVVGLAAGLGACRERAEAVQGESELRTLVRQMIPSVERAAGLKFKTPPVVERRSRTQVRRRTDRRGFRSCESPLAGSVGQQTKAVWEGGHTQRSECLF